MNNEELIARIEDLQLSLSRAKSILADKNNLIAHMNFRIAELKAENSAYLEVLYPLLDLYRSIPEELYDDHILLEYPEREVIIGKKTVRKPAAKLTYGVLKKIWKTWSTPSGHLLLDEISKLKQVYEAAHSIHFNRILNYVHTYEKEDIIEIGPELEKIKILEEALLNIDIPNICCVSEYSRNQAAKCKCHSDIAQIAKESQKNETRPVKKLTTGSVTIYTDGACSGNPGAGGFAFIIKDNNGNIIAKDSQHGGGYVTNNQMELSAVEKALEALIYKDHEIRPETITIISDSEYVIKGMNEWVDKWMANDWKTATNKPVSNETFWRDILSRLRFFKDLSRPPKIIWQHTKRNVFPEQAECDKLAKEAVKGNI